MSGSESAKGWSFDEVITGISDVEDSTLDDEHIFDLKGRYVGDAPKKLPRGMR